MGILLSYMYDLLLIYIFFSFQLTNVQTARLTSVWELMVDVFWKHDMFTNYFLQRDFSVKYSELIQYTWNRQINNKDTHP